MPEQPGHSDQDPQGDAPAHGGEVSVTTRAHADDAAHSTHDDYGPELGRHFTHPPELPHFIQLLFKAEQSTLKKDYVKEHGGPEPSIIEKWIEIDAEGHARPVEGEHPTVLQTLHIGPLEKPMPLVGYAPWENHIFLLIGATLTVSIFYAITANIRKDWKAALRRPTRAQVVVEAMVGGFDDFVKGVLGEKHGRQYMPFIATLFFLILVCNLMGMVPLMKPPTASVVITFSLSLCTFFFVQATAWGRLGPLNYMYHMAGQPKDLVGWLFSPLLFLLEAVSDFFAKPVSLALRLFGNMLGKDILLGAFLGMGISLLSIIPVVGGLSAVIGIPLTYPFYFLGLLLSAIQALVFALLSTIYLMLVLPHDEHHDGEHGAEHGHGTEAHAH